ncbi:NAD-dependent epimerase/dehydratase family protein [Halegenticoccus soli]|uniref:NAD-dependent epimerase/dehydratase family protein n=1 Tax=Halegenticoccus soli TaxID=1985678 RepID=UPI000C6D8477|nr:NAD(P)-dependent oxidoreductase [Halegenticoccus soli]
MSTILVTGGLGRLGRWTVDHFVEAGWNVTCVDVDHPGFGQTPRPGITFRAVDLTDAGETRAIVEESAPDHVVHLAAIPNPEVHAGPRIIENNVMSTYNVLTSAGRDGIPVTWASSESAYGFPFAAKPRLPEYLPIDENHPMEPEDPYGASKVLGEELAAMVTRSYDVPVVSLRLSNVQYPGNYSVGKGTDDLHRGVGNFWSYVDGRDVTRAIERAVDTDVTGHEPFIVAADENYLGRSTADAVKEWFGRLPQHCDLSGDESALSNEKAKTVLRWEPTHTWRTAADEEVTAPRLTMG